MLRHIKTLGMDEEEAKADYARHNQEVLEYVKANKVLKKRLMSEYIRTIRVRSACPFRGLRCWHPVTGARRGTLKDIKSMHVTPLPELDSVQFSFARSWVTMYNVPQVVHCVAS